MRKIFAISCIALVPFLSGCEVLLIGGAVATGVMVAEDRRTVGTMTEDEGIEQKASNRISEKVKDAHINVTSYNRLVLLSGEVPTQAAKDDAERIARAVENVRNVFNELQIGANTAMKSRSNDSVITSKVKGRFVDSGKFSPIHIKVVTENSVVYLMGLVKKQEATEATEITRTTGGVSKVVRLFEYLD